MVREIIKIGRDQIAEIGEHHSMVEYNMDRIMGTDHGIIRTIEVILGEEILEGILDTEEIIEMITMKEVEVGLGIDNIPIIEGKIEVTVGLDQSQY